MIMTSCYCMSILNLGGNPKIYLGRGGGFEFAIEN